MKRKILVALTMFIILCTASFATDESVLFQGNWLHTPNSNYGDGVNGLVRIEKPVFKNLSVAGDVDYHGKTYHTHYGWVSGVGVMGDLIFRPELSSRFHPYVLGGLGWYWWDFRENSDLQDKGIEVNMGDALGTKLAVGCDIPLNDRWSLNVEWAYFHSHIPKDSHYKIDGTFANVVGGDTVGQEETNVGIGLRYKF